MTISEYLWLLLSFPILFCYFCTISVDCPNTHLIKKISWLQFFNNKQLFYLKNKLFLNLIKTFKFSRWVYMVFLTRSIHLQLARAKFQAQRRSGIQEYKILQQRFKKKKKSSPWGSRLNSFNILLVPSINNF